MQRIFKQLQNEFGSENLCARFGTMFLTWREDWKRMQKEQEKSRRAEKKRIDNLMAEQKKMAKKMVRNTTICGGCK